MKYITKPKAKKIIEFAGGPTKFASRIGLPKKSRLVARVSMWKRNGIPARVQVDCYTALDLLYSEMEAAPPKPKKVKAVAA